MPGPSNALILKASAGSGKTFALAKEFIKHLLLNPIDYYQTLALTFTNDAKNEMKSRIMNELTLLASGKATDMLAAIRSDFDTQGLALSQEQLWSRSKLALNNLLNDYSRFNVSTLDHFFTQLVRHLARELKLNLGYELDLDTEKALGAAIDLMYNSTSAKVKKWLRAFINSKIEEDKGWNIEYNIKTLGSKLFHDSFIDIHNKLIDNADNLETFVSQLQDQVSAYENKMKLLGKQALEHISANRLAPSDFRQYTATVFQNLMNRKIDLSKPFTATFLKGDWATKTSQKKNEIDKCALSGLNDLHSQIIELANSNQKPVYIEAKIILRNIYSYGVLSVLSDNLWQYRTSNNLLLLSDTAFILNGVISKSDVPFIYEKIGARYKHILIDEFQDTSTQQWKNILPLLKHSLSNEGSVMLVGDIKQSIYRWRGGDVHLLMQQAAHDLADFSPTLKPLDTNYRSGKKIIEFNNAFFETARNIVAELIEGLESNSEKLKTAYGSLSQKAYKNFDGYVKVKFFNDTEDLAWNEQALAETEKAIYKAREDGFEAEDILILARKNEQVSKIAQYLLKKGINTITDEALQLDQSPKVLFLVNALQHILSPQDEFVLANCRYFLTLISEQKDASFFEISSGGLSALNHLQQSTAYEAIESLVEKFHLNIQFDSFLQGFQDLCLSLSQKKYISISSFLNRWYELNENSKTAPTIVMGKFGGAVQVKSIHKSKGLESLVVIMPLTSGRLFNSKHVFWPTELPTQYSTWGSLPLPHNGKLADTHFSSLYENESFDIVLEELNTLYVAFTRAVERLYVFVSNKEEKGTVQKLIKGVISNSTFALQPLSNEDEFEFGTLDKARNNIKKNNYGIPLDSYPTSSIESKFEEGKPQFWKHLNTEKANRIRQGEIMHVIMSKLTHLKKPELGNKLDLILHQLIKKGIVAKSQIDNYRETVQSFFDHNPKLFEWFGPDWEVLNEHKIFTYGETVIPDRVMIKGNRVVIMDYKKEQRSDAHLAQIKKYGAVLSQMRYEVEGMYLLYMSDLEMIEVR